MGTMPANRLTAFTRMTDLEGKREFHFPDLRGATVVNTTGHPVGIVEEIFVDPNTLEPAMALLHYKKFLNFNTKKLLVPWSELQILNENQVRTRPTEEQLADAPEWSQEMTDWSPVRDYWTRRVSGSAGTEPVEDELSVRP